MSFSFKCKHCGTDIQAEESWVGKQLSCPSCGQMVAIPLPPPSAPAPAPTAPPPAPNGYAAPAPAYSAPAPAYTNNVYMAPAQAPVCSGKATASLILGIVSFIGVPFCGLIALILGIIAQSNINESNGLITGKGKAITGIIFGVWSIIRLPFICIFAAMILPALSQAREKGRSINCMNNMKMIGLGLVMYTNDFKCYYPNADECKEKIFDYVGDEKAFRCPSNTTSEESYRFFVNGKSTIHIDSLSETIAAVCTCTHGNNQVNVLFADGHVETLPKAKVDAAIQNAAKGTMPVLK